MENTEKKKKNPAAFTIWTSPENIDRWKRYREIRKNTFKSQNDFVVAALNEYIANHPLTEDEKQNYFDSLLL